VDDALVLCAAVLHDTIEDTETRYEEVVSQFGRDRRRGPRSHRRQALPKASASNCRSRHAPHLSRAAKLVKLADKIANVRDVADHPPSDGRWSAARDFDGRSGWWTACADARRARSGRSTRLRAPAR